MKLIVYLQLDTQKQEGYKKIMNYDAYDEEIKIILKFYQKEEYIKDWNRTFYGEIETYKKMGLFQTVPFIVTRYWK